MHLGCIHTYTSSCRFLIWSFRTDCNSRSKRDVRFLFCKQPCPFPLLVSTYRPSFCICFFFYSCGSGGWVVRSLIKRSAIQFPSLAAGWSGQDTEPQIASDCCPIGVWLCVCEWLTKNLLCGAGWAENTVLLLMSWLACCMAASAITICGDGYMYS